MTYPDIAFRSIKYVDFGVGDPMYYFAISSSIYRVSNYKKMSNTSPEFLTLSSANQVHDILPKNQYEFMFAANDGLYATTYQYTLSNDLTFFTEQQVNQIYRDMLASDIPELTSNAIRDHLEKMHRGNSVIGKVNTDIVDVRFSMIPVEWNTVDVTDDEVFISNDMVSEVLFGTEENNDGISVYTDNFITADTPKFNYIIKRYTSGITELYLLLDTTNTYYINHIQGAGWSQFGSDYIRKNIEGFGRDVARISYDRDTDNPIDLYKTSISVVIDQNMLSVERLFDYQVNGCSLPLKIYPDIDGAAAQSDRRISGMYQSLILPSQVKYASNGSIYSEFDIGENRIAKCFKAECFGTD